MFLATTVRTEVENFRPLVVPGRELGCFHMAKEFWVGLALETSKSYVLRSLNDWLGLGEQHNLKILAVS